MQVPEDVARSFEVVSPPVRLEETPVKLVFPVEDIAELRGRATELGGAIDPVESEWQFDGVTVCDAHDPEETCSSLASADRGRAEPRL